MCSVTISLQLDCVGGDQLISMLLESFDSPQSLIESFDRLASGCFDAGIYSIVCLLFVSIAMTP